MEYLTKFKNILSLAFFLSLSFSGFSQYTIEDLKKAAIEVANERVKMARDSGYTVEANTLVQQIAVMKNTPAKEIVVPQYGFGFFPVPTQTSSLNPHLKRLNEVAVMMLGIADKNIVKATPKSIIQNPSVFMTDFGVYSNGTNNIPYLFWSVTSPYSIHRNNPELFKLLLHSLYMSSDYYLMGGNDENTNIINNWFVGRTFAYGWLLLKQTYASYIPPFLLKRIDDAAAKMGAYYFNRATDISNLSKTESYRYYRYANRDISFAESIMYCGIYHNNQTWKDTAQVIVNITAKDALQPDGGYNYIAGQNEVVSYHGGNNQSMARIYAVSGYIPALNCLKATENYCLLSTEKLYTPEFYTATVWKNFWNGIPGFSGEFDMYACESPYLKTMYDLRSKRILDRYKDDNSLLSFSFYKDVPNKAIPNNYLVYDRNVEGLRFRNNDFSYGVTLRDTYDTTGRAMQTILGALITDSLSSKMNSAVQVVQAKIQFKNTGNPEQEHKEWGTVIQNPQKKINMSKIIAGFSTLGDIRSQDAGTIKSYKDMEWQTFQQWIALPDRLVGIVETFPKSNNQKAYEIDGRIRLFTPNNSPITIVQSGVNYKSGLLGIKVLDHNFTTIDTTKSWSIRNGDNIATTDDRDSREIRFRYNIPANITTLISTFPATTNRYFISEIRPSGITQDLTTVERYNQNQLKGLIVTLAGKKYSVWRNFSSTAQSLPITSYLSTLTGVVHSVHFERGNDPGVAPIQLTGNTVNIPALSQILVISSNDINDHERDWKNYDELKTKLPAITIFSGSANDGVCKDSTIKFTMITNNLGSNTTYRWKTYLKGIITDTGITTPTFSSSSLKDSTAVFCEMKNTLSNNTVFTVNSNEITIRASTKPSVSVSSQALLFKASTLKLITTAPSSSSYRYYWNADNGYATTNLNMNTNYYDATLRNQTVKNVTPSHSGKYIFTASLNGCQVVMPAVTVTVKDQNTWLGTTDNSFTRPDNWEFGQPKAKFSALQNISNTTNVPTVNLAIATNIDQLVLKTQSNIKILGRLSVGGRIDFVQNLSTDYAVKDFAIGNQLTASYTLNPQYTISNISIKWFRSLSAFGKDGLLVGTGSSYILTAADMGKFISFQITANVQGYGTQKLSSELIKIQTKSIGSIQTASPTIVLSFRKIIPTYTGPAIRVRRERDDVEFDVPFKNDGYIATQVLEDSIGYDNAFITTWYDQSVNGLHAKQTSTAAQPYIVKTGKISSLNYRPAVEFDGTRYLTIAYNTLLNPVNGFALFYLAKQFKDNPATDFRTAMIGRNDGATYGLRHTFTNGKQVIGFNVNSSSSYLSNDFSDSVLQITNYGDKTLNTKTLSVNKTQTFNSTTTSTNWTDSTNDLIIGNRSSFFQKVHYSMSEVVLFNNTLDPTKRVAFEDNQLEYINENSN